MSAAFEERLARVERSAVRWRTTALGSLVLVGLGAIAPPQTDDTLRARRFELVDEAGAVRAEVGIDEDGSAGFFLRDAANRVRAALVHDDAQTALLILDDAGTVRIGVAQYAHGGGGVALHGAGSGGGAVLYMKDGNGSLRFFDTAGDVRLELPD